MYSFLKIMTRKYGEDLYGADFTEIAFYKLRNSFLANYSITACETI